MDKKDKPISDLHKSLQLLAKKLSFEEYTLVAGTMFQLHAGMTFGYKKYDNLTEYINNVEIIDFEKQNKILYEKLELEDKLDLTFSDNDDLIDFHRMNNMINTSKRCKTVNNNINNVNKNINVFPPDFIGDLFKGLKKDVNIKSSRKVSIMKNGVITTLESEEDKAALAALIKQKQSEK